MKTEEEIKEHLKWCKKEYRAIQTNRTQCTNREAALKYYRGAINTIEWVLEDSDETVS